MTGYTANPPNLLPVDPASGGQPNMANWWLPSGAAAPTPAGGVMTIPAGTTVCTSPTASGIASSPVPAVPGTTYTAAIDCGGQPATIRIYWVTDDGTILQPAAAARSGVNRNSATATAPPNVSGLMVTVTADVPTSG